MWRRIVVVLVAIATAAFFVGAASADDSRGNSEVVHLCRDGGWEVFGTTDKQVFRDPGDCARYGARGGTLLPLLQAIANTDPACISNVGVPPSGVCFTVTGFGLAPGSEVIVTEVVEGERIVRVLAVDAEGNVFWQLPAGCAAGSEEIVLSISASGVTAAGVPLTTPEQSFSIFCTRG